MISSEQHQMMCRGIELDVKLTEFLANLTQVLKMLLERFE
jgi:hypothetical protein